MKKLCYFIFLFCFLLSPSGFSPGCRAAEDLDPREVNDLIDRAAQVIKGKQNRDGSWGGSNTNYVVGYTALCSMALLNSGIPARDASIQKALTFLRKYTPEKTSQSATVYCVALQTMVYCLAEPDRDKALIRRNIDWFQKIQVKTGNNTGGWGYGREGESDTYADVSNSQFAVLALYEAERVGVKCTPETWNRTKKYWENMQGNDGSWGYLGPSGASGSRTCAGIASLLIASGMSEQGAAAVEQDNIYCCLDPDSVSATRIQKGLNWLGREFSPATNPRMRGQYYYYYMYGVERVGRMTGLRYFGKHDWYRDGTKALLDRGLTNGFWSGGGEDDLLASSFALLFLARGRRPILLSKIQYEIDDDSWNAHTQDVNHLTQFVEKAWKMDLTWQTTDWERASVEDLLQSPVLYICGNKNPLPRDRNRADKIVEKLRQYLDQGGFIFAEAYSDDTSFDAGFRSMMQRVLPEDDYKLRLLEQDHPIWNAEFPIPTDQIRPIEGVDFGCQTNVVYCPPVHKNAKFTENRDDNSGKNNDKEHGVFRLVAAQRPMSISQYRPSLSCLWEIAKLVDRGDPYAKSVQNQIDAGLAIGCNVLAYATNRELQTKVDRAQEVKIIPKDAFASGRGTLSVGLLQHGGGSNCAPRAIPRLMEAAVARFGAPVAVQVEKVSLLDSNLSDYPILFMHGRTAFRFSTQERDALHKYIDRGGFLFVNSICASSAFTKSFEEEIKLVFPDDPLTLIPMDDPLYGDEYSGTKIEKVQMRIPQKATGRKLENTLREVTPELKGIRRAERLGLIFSPYDISCALEKLNSMECKGYSQQSALDLGLNTLLYALEHI